MPELWFVSAAALSASVSVCVMTDCMRWLGIIRIISISNACFKLKKKHVCYCFCLNII